MKHHQTETIQSQINYHSTKETTERLAIIIISPSSSSAPKQ